MLTVNAGSSSLKLALVEDGERRADEEVSARDGANIRKPADELAWYDGLTLVAALAPIATAARAKETMTPAL